jgi:hypothetical protein
MPARSFPNVLMALAWLVLIGGWVLAVGAYFVIGSETCTTVGVPLAGDIEACQDTTAQSVLLFVVVGFAATVGSLFLWALRWILLTLQAIEENTRRGS